MAGLLLKSMIMIIAKKLVEAKIKRTKDLIEWFDVRYEINKRDLIKFDKEIKRLLEELRQEFNSKIKYKGKYYSWDTIIQLKTRELARYILGKNNKIDFKKQYAEFNSIDSKELREKILSLTISEARKIGINKNTLWHMQKRIKTKKSLRVYSKMHGRLVHL
jgi:CRISPR-associated protein Cas1